MTNSLEIAENNIRDTLDLFFREVCRVNCHDILVRNRSYLNWARYRTADSLLDALLKYDEELSKTPPSLDDFLLYLRSHTEFTITEIDYDWLEGLKEPAEIKSTDLDFIITELTKYQVQAFHLQGIANGHAILTGGKKTKNRIWLGPKDYMEYTRLWWTKGPPENYIQIAGLLHDNTGLVESDLLDKLQPQDKSSRIKTGFDNIDNSIIIGPKASRYIGLAGMSGDGKTMLLNTLVYNMALQGKNILYVSLEHDPQEIWEFITFIHCGYFKTDFIVPSLDNWNLGLDARPPITQKDVDNIATVLEDIKSQRGLPGKIDAQQIFTWNGIIDYLNAHHGKNQYDVLVIDYMTRLKVDGPNEKEQDAQRKETIHAGFNLSRSFDNQRGIVIITPMQINREAHKSALAAKEGETHYNINAIRYFSEYQHDMDLILAIYSDDDMKTNNQAVLEKLKQRKGTTIRSMLLDINPLTKQVTVKGQNMVRREAEEEVVRQDTIGNWW
jgi:hypothetical protein